MAKLYSLRPKTVGALGFKFYCKIVVILTSQIFLFSQCISLSNAFVVVSLFSEGYFGHLFPTLVLVRNSKTSIIARRRGVSFVVLE